MSVFHRIFPIAAMVLLLAPPAFAERASQVQALLELLKIEETIEIMQAEGASYGQSLAESMDIRADAARWGETVSRIYDAQKMYEMIATTLEDGLRDTDLAPILNYYGSDDARRIVMLELSARRAFLDPDTEALAAEQYEAMSARAAPLTAQVDGLIQDSDLIERNVSGALNAELMFFRGLNDGGAFDLSEADMLADVWAREEELRQSTQDWMRAFLTMAYQPLEPDQIDAYAAFWRTEAGRDLNRVIFAGFDRMYEDISYLLGLAVAEEMRSQKL